MVFRGCRQRVVLDWSPAVAAMLTIERKRIEPDIVLLELKGKISIGWESQHVEEQVDELIRENEKKVIFDLSGADYIDSTGVGIMALCAGKLKQAGGGLRLTGAKGIVQQVFKVVRMENIVGVYATPAAAAESFSTGGQIGQSA